MNLLQIFSQLLIVATIIGAADITTIYKFNTVRSALDSPLYLNTCTVSVHIQENDRGLPLFNINGDSSLFRVIPPLYSGTNDTGWQALRENDSLLHLSSIQSNAPDSLDIFKWKPSIEEHLSIRLPNASELKSKIMDHDGEVFKDRSGMDGPNIFLRVRFDEKTASEEGITITIYFGSVANIVKNYLFVKFRSNNELMVCWKLQEPCYTSKISRGFSQNNTKGSLINPHVYTVRVYMFIQEDTREFIVFDENNLKLHKTGVQVDYSFGKLTLVKHRYANKKNSGDPVRYELVLFDHFYTNISLVSPWLDIKRNTSLYILNYSMSNLNQTVKVYIEEQLTRNILDLKCQDVDQVNLIKHPDQDEGSVTMERVLLKADIINPQHWEGLKRIVINTGPGTLIGNIWEGRDESVIKFFGKQNCTKSGVNEIYTSPENEVQNAEQILFCHNGGILDDSGCRCPPGFTGIKCETPCGRNLYGQKCSKLCSKTPTECKGMILCTPSYGCTCAPGYYGEQCLDKCKDGFYGVDCKQNCSRWCETGCDIYTGTCQGKCKFPYSIGPSCNEFHSYLREAPQIVDSSFNGMKLKINLSANNTVMFKNNPMLYMVQYREDISTTWKNDSIDLHNGSIFTYEVSGLKPGTGYYFRVILIDETLQIQHDPVLSKVSKGYTKCINTDLGSNLSVTSTTNTSISLIWKDLGKNEKNECPYLSYILEVEETVDGYVETLQYTNIKTNYFTVEDLAPSQTYRITLKKLTWAGEAVSISSVIDVTTNDTIDLSLEIVGVRMTKNDSHVEFKWFPSPLYKMYYIKCKLKRYMCCGFQNIYSPVQVAVTNYTSYYLSYYYLEPYAEYQVFVTADEKQDMKLNNFSLITKGQLPEDSPILLKHKEKIGFESAQLFWENFTLSCQKINGIFKKYVIELYDIHKLHAIWYETTENHIFLTNLQPKTQYSLKIRYVNHVGYNPKIYSEYNFTTQSIPVLIPQELAAYKNGFDIVGLRWKLPETNLTITGFNIQLETEIWNKTLTVSSNLDTFYCHAWPSFICFDVTDLKPNTQYSITVTIHSEKFPTGEFPTKPIYAITKENISLPFSDIRVEHYIEKNMTISWRIPSLLNGILRKFVIEVEHLSSFDEALCCKSLLMINHEVTQEKERYSHVLNDIHSASSYQIIIRPFTKRLGPPEHKIVDTPPHQEPIMYMPRVKLNNKIIDLTEMGHKDHISVEQQQLAREKLIIVQDLSTTMPVLDGHVSITSDLAQMLGNYSWWIFHICDAGNEIICSVDFGDQRSQELEDPYYGRVSRKELLVGHEYIIIVAQVNKYQSTRSYTLAKSKKFTV